MMPRGNSLAMISLSTSTKSVQYCYNVRSSQCSELCQDVFLTNWDGGGVLWDSINVAVKNCRGAYSRKKFPHPIHAKTPTHLLGLACVLPVTLWLKSGQQSSSGNSTNDFQKSDFCNLCYLEYRIEINIERTYLPNYDHFVNIE